MNRSESAVLDERFPTWLHSCDEPEHIANRMDTATKTSKPFAVVPRRQSHTNTDSLTHSFFWVDSDSADFCRLYPPGHGEMKLLQDKERDLLVSWATMPGELAVRFPGGSPFINTIDELVRKYSHVKHFAEIMANVPVETSAKVQLESNHSQLPCMHVTFKKFLHMPLMPKNV